MPDGAPGRTNGRDMIWLDRALNQVERRCTLTHELVHIERGHTSCQPTAVEKAVRVETARRLICLDDLAKQLAWSRSLTELAEELWVTEGVLLDRLTSLTSAEWATLKTVETQT
ncbi:conserved hypothetical protein [Arthrobacter sp. 9V]|nr:conserved hypothetical protein [Arthrobacter sp. 9V]